jgi:hypothetical protein
LLVNPPCMTGHLPCVSLLIFITSCARSFVRKSDVNY